MMNFYRRETRSDSDYVYYHDDTIAFKLNRRAIKTQEESFVADNVVRYLVLEEGIFTVDKYDNIKIIPK